MTEVLNHFLMLLFEEKAMAKEKGDLLCPQQTPLISCPGLVSRLKYVNRVPLVVLHRRLNKNNGNQDILSSDPRCQEFCVAFCASTLHCSLDKKGSECSSGLDFLGRNFCIALHFTHQLKNKVQMAKHN